MSDDLSDLAKKLLLELREIKSEKKQVELVEQFFQELLIDSKTAEIVEDSDRKNTSITEPIMIYYTGDNGRVLRPRTY
jgi:hypothetical protein